MNSNYYPVRRRPATKWNTRNRGLLYVCNGFSNVIIITMYILVKDGVIQATGNKAIFTKEGTNTYKLDVDEGVKGGYEFRPIKSSNRFRVVRILDAKGAKQKAINAVKSLIEEREAMVALGLDVTDVEAKIATVKSEYETSVEGEEVVVAEGTYEEVQPVENFQTMRDDIIGKRGFVIGKVVVEENKPNDLLYYLPTNELYPTLEYVPGTDRLFSDENEARRHGFRLEGEEQVRQEKEKAKGKEVENKGSPEPK